MNRLNKIPSFEEFNSTKDLSEYGEGTYCFLDEKIGESYKCLNDYGILNAPKQTNTSSINTSKEFSIIPEHSKESECSSEFVSRKSEKIFLKNTKETSVEKYINDLKNKIVPEEKFSEKVSSSQFYKKKRIPKSIFLTAKKKSFTRDRRNSN